MGRFRRIMGSYETKVMSVSHEIKSQLAKLLATEDLVVEHRQVDTAQFNVHTRVLTLPLWEKASNVVYDMLVGHEVGHALFTPDEDLPKNIPHQFVNVVEDARIEKLMKRKYMGLAKTFFKGYNELSDQDFFSLEGEDISKMNLADRANLWFKIGNYVDIPIECGEETEIINMIADTETFADVLIAAEALYKYCKEQNQQEKAPEEMQSQQTTQGGGSSAQDGSEEQETDGDNSNSSGNGSGEEKTSTNNQSDQRKPGGESFDDEPEVRTVDNLEESLRELISQHGQDNVYVEIPKVNLDSIIASNEDIHKVINIHFAKRQESVDDYLKQNSKEYINIFENVDLEYRKFKMSSQKEVNYMVKEFECKKAADSYARSTVSRTGVLDCTKLHTYKYNEDLFKKINVIPNGKNHGLIFVLDWSGSMSQVLQDTCKQLFNLIWFCKKISIPFEVYAFTNEWNRRFYDEENDQYVAANLKSHYQKKEGLLAIDDHFNMMNILTSKVSSKELENQMVNIWRISCYYNNSHSVYYNVPEKLSLSGTPLNEALVSLHQILPKFQKENKLQKVQCIVLTDGEANQLSHHVEIKRNWESEPYIGCRRLNPDTSFIRDRKIGMTYKVEYEWHKFTDTILKNLKDNFPMVNFIGIRVLSSRDANNFIKMYYEIGKKDFEKIQNDWRKFKTFNITKSGYDAYFGMSSSNLSQESEFEVKEDATKAQIKSAFVKSLKNKKLNKKVLGEFISLVV